MRGRRRPQRLAGRQVKAQADLLGAGRRTKLGEALRPGGQGEQRGICVLGGVGIEHLAVAQHPRATAPSRFEPHAQRADPDAPVGLLGELDRGRRIDRGKAIAPIGEGRIDRRGHARGGGRPQRHRGLHHPPRALRAGDQRAGPPIQIAQHTTGELHPRRQRPRQLGMLLTRHRQRPRPRQPAKGLTRRCPLLPSRPTVTKPPGPSRGRRPAGLPIGRGALVMTGQLIRGQRPQPPTLRPGRRAPRRPQRRRRHQRDSHQTNQGQQPNNPAAHGDSLNRR